MTVMTRWSTSTTLLSSRYITKELTFSTVVPLHYSKYSTYVTSQSLFYIVRHDNNNHAPGQPSTWQFDSAPACPTTSKSEYKKLQQQTHNGQNYIIWCYGATQALHVRPCSLKGSLSCCAKNIWAKAINIAEPGATARFPQKSQYPQLQLLKYENHLGALLAPESRLSRCMRSFHFCMGD